MAGEGMREVTPEHERLAKEVFHNVPYVKLLGMELLELKPGEAHLRLKMRDELRQPHGVLHGGATASLIDTATAFAILACLSEGEKASTIDLTVHYLRPVVDGEVTCTARVVKSGKRVMTVSAEVFDHNGEQIASAISAYARL